jgi:hypothetical protein
MKTTILNEFNRFFLELVKKEARFVLAFVINLFKNVLKRHTGVIQSHFINTDKLLMLDRRDSWIEKG